MPKPRLSKILALILCTALCLNLITPAAHAEEIPEPTAEAEEVPATQDTEPEYPEALLPALTAPTGVDRDIHVFNGTPIDVNDDTIVDELPEKREIGAKHFQLSDSSRAAVVYGFPIHETDASGQLVEIDNTLRPAEADGMTNYIQKSVSRQTTFFGVPEEGRLLRYDLTDGGLEWGLLSEGLQIPQLTYEPSHAEKGKEKLATKALSGLLTYEDVLPGLNLEYGLVGHDLKENLVLLSPETAAVNAEGFTFRLHLENRSAEQKDDKTIRILDASGEEEYLISAPYMTDEAGEYSTDLQLILEESEEAGTYLVRLLADPEWLLSEERVYPVRIDPSIALAYSGYHTLQNATLASVDPNANLYNYGSMYIGRQSSMQNVRGAYKIQNLPVIGESDMIIQASVSFKIRSYSQLASSHGGTVVMNMFPLITDVAISALNWGNLAGYTGDYVIDTQSVEPNEAANLKPRVTWDITRAVKTWYNDGTNYGMVIASENESPTTVRYVQLTTATNSQYINENSPIFTLTYLNQEGLESYLTYHSSGSGTMGALHVSDFNGNLVYTYSDLDMSGAYLPISISHVYNHSRRGTSALVGSGMYYGNGMRLNLSMRIESCSVEGYPYQLTDADGTVHYFSLKSGTAGAVGSVYEKEFETTTILSKTSSGYTLDDGGTILYFFNTSGYLTQISDITNSKTQTLTYTSGRLTKVTDGAGRYATLTYNSSGYLTGITDPAGRTTSYAYTNGNLTTITRPDGLTVTLTYTLTDGTYMLTKVKDVDNRSIGITYDTHAPYRVKQLLEYGADSSQGQRLTWTYSEGETTVTDRQGRSETMLFDNSGHTVVTRDGEGHAVYGGYGETADNLKHSLLYLSNMRGSVRNLSVNHDFEASAMSPWTAFANGEGSISLDTTTVKEGQKSLKIISTNSNTLTYGTCQQLSIPGVAGKTYTLSGYVYFSSYNPSSSVGFKLGFSYMNTSNSWQNIYGAVVSDQSGWTRFSMTYTVPTSIGQEKIRIFFLMGGTGTCYLDSVQLAEGSVSESYNMLENGHFSDAAGTTTPSKWTVISSSTGDGVTTGHDGNGYGLNGEATVDKGIYQVIPVKNGLAGDNYVFGAWAKAESVPRIGLFKNDSRDFAIRIRFIKSNNTYEERVFNFEAKTPNWQYLSGSVVAPCAYVSIQYALIYNNQKNPVVFDDAELFRERFGDLLDYDTEGRIISRTDPDGLTTTYEYQWTGRPEIKKVTFPDGTSTNYSYNSTNRRLLSVTDASGKVLTYSYDTNGNATSVSTTASGLTLSSGTTAYSGSYVSSVTDTFGNTTNFSYNQNKGLLTTVTNAKSVATGYTYNANNDQLTQVQTGSSQVQYGYTNTRLVSLTHNTTTATSGNVVYNLTYNTFGTQTAIKVGTQNLASYTYAANNGELTRTTYGNGQYSEPTYDSLGRIIAMSYNGTVGYRYYYGSDGRIGLEEDLINSVSWRYEYDQSGKILRISGSNGESFAYEYNTTTGELTGQTFYNSANPSGIHDTYTYANYSGTGERVLSQISRDGGNATVSYVYDGFYRATKTVKLNAGASVTNSYGFRSGTASNSTSVIPSSLTQTVKNNGGSTVSSFTYNYTYDSLGNIETISEGTTLKLKYYYDSLNQLTREDNAYLNKTITYSYDLGGNLTSVKEYAYQTGSTVSGTATATNSYTYGDSNWKDKLTAYNGNIITYDAIGNPLTYYNGYSFTWTQGRRLATVSGNSKTISYAYNSDGIRIKKTVNGTVTNYTLDGTKVIKETTGSDTIWYYYDESGTPVAFRLNNTLYLYTKNLQGDITGIRNTAGTLLVSYVYNAWGKVSATNVAGTTEGTNLIAKNPYLYRGYRYDTETGLYYLNSRYYDPQTGRFINADVFASTGFSGLGCNMFAYCWNNPVEKSDKNGFGPDQPSNYRNTVLAIDLSSGGGGLGGGGTIGIVVAVVAVVGVMAYGAAKGVEAAAIGVKQLFDGIIADIRASKIAAIEKQLSDIAGEYGNLQCDKAADAMEKVLNKKKVPYERININWWYGTDFVYSIMYNRIISENAYHVGILYEGNIYCNIHPYGLPVELWIADFYGIGTKDVYFGPRKWRP